MEKHNILNEANEVEPNGSLEHDARLPTAIPLGIDGSGVSDEDFLSAFFEPSALGVDFSVFPSLGDDILGSLVPESENPELGFLAALGGQ
jgi:hypothetical protein